MLQAEQSSWLSYFPTLSGLNSPAWKKLLLASNHIVLQEGDMVFKAGEACMNYLFITSGVVRVQKTSSNGHEITLYRLFAGQVCEITTTCLLASQYYHAEAIAETPVRAVLVPKEIFHEALSDNPEFRQYVYSSLEQRVNVLLDFIEEVAFIPVHNRLARCLLNNMNSTQEINATHYQIATNLGTAREVVSRILKGFEKDGMVKLGRGKIKVLNPDLLVEMSECEE